MRLVWHTLVWTIRLIFVAMIELCRSFSKFISVLLLSSFFGVAHTQTESPTFWKKAGQSLRYAKEDVNIGFGMNSSGVYTSKYRHDLSMGAGFQFFAGAYLPYADNMFLHVQLGLSFQQFQQKAGDNSLNFSMLFLELPVYISAQLPMSNSFESRFLLGWQSNLMLNATQKGEYPEFWGDDDSRLIYNTADFMRVDFGLYFGFAAEYRRWMIRTSCHVGINSLINSDTGMLNTFKLEIGYFLFRKL